MNLYVLSRNITVFAPRVLARWAVFYRDHEIAAKYSLGPGQFAITNFAAAF